MEKQRIGMIAGVMLALLFVVGCNEDGSDGSNGGDTESEVDTESGGDGDTDSDSDTDSDADSDTDSDTEPGPENPWGFDMRMPGADQIECTEEYYMTTETVAFDEADLLCTFSFNGTEGVIYVQNNATGCEWFMSQVPLYTSVGAWISVDGQNTALSDVAYDSGGNHMNDALEFTYDGVHYRMYHSSFGFGWRKCHSMDCMQVLGSGVPMIEDGCTCDRTLPVTCVTVEKDGTWPALEDTFEVCVGDETCG